MKPWDSIRNGDATVQGPRDDMTIFSLIRVCAAVAKINGRYQEHIKLGAGAASTINESGGLCFPFSSAGIASKMMYRLIHDPRDFRRQPHSPAARRSRARCRSAP